MKRSREYEIQYKVDAEQNAKQKVHYRSVVSQKKSCTSVVARVRFVFQLALHHEAATIVPDERRQCDGLCPDRRWCDGRVTAP